MEDDNKVYSDIKAYKSVRLLTILSTIIGGIGLFACVFFIALTVRVSRLYLFGVATTGLFGLVSVGIFIRKRVSPKLIFKQENEILYLFPGTNKKVILPLKDIIEVSKKNSAFVLGSGQLIITTKTNHYFLNINAVDAIYKSLDESIKLLKNTSMV